MLVHPEPRSVLIIGHGGGATLYGASANPVTERIRVIEIIGPVYEVTQRWPSEPATLASAGCWPIPGSSGMSATAAMCCSRMRSATM